VASCSSRRRWCGWLKQLGWPQKPEGRSGSSRQPSEPAAPPQAACSTNSNGAGGGRSGAELGRELGRSITHQVRQPQPSNLPQAMARPRRSSFAEGVAPADHRSRRSAASGVLTGLSIPPALRSAASPAWPQQLPQCNSALAGGVRGSTQARIEAADPRFPPRLSQALGNLALARLDVGAGDLRWIVRFHAPRCFWPVAWTGSPPVNPAIGSDAVVVKQVPRGASLTPTASKVFSPCMGGDMSGADLGIVRAGPRHASSAARISDSGGPGDNKNELGYQRADRTLTMQLQQLGISPLRAMRVQHKFSPRQCPTRCLPASGPSRL